MTPPAEHGKSKAQLPSANEDGDAQPIVAAIKSAIGAKHFDHWLANRSRFDLADDTLHIFVPNPFIANWLLKRFRTPFNKAAAELLGPSGKCEVSVDESLQEAKSSRTVPATSTARSTSTTTALTVADTNAAVSSPDSEVRKLAVPASNRRRFQTFATLVSGECNDLAAMAARQVSEFPGERFNPLYIHGPTGVGKTHLLEAIYCETKTQSPSPERAVHFQRSLHQLLYAGTGFEDGSVISPAFSQRQRAVGGQHRISGQQKGDSGRVSAHGCSGDRTWRPACCYRRSSPAFADEASRRIDHTIHEWPGLSG